MMMRQWLHKWFGKNNPLFLPHQTKDAEAMPLWELLENQSIPGIAYGIANSKSVVANKAFGLADIEAQKALKPQHIFRIASVSKPIAALALGHMLEEGLLDLNQSIYDLLPDYPYHGKDIRIGQLANHTAGIRSYIGKEYFLNKPYSIAEGVAIFKEDPLLFAPGTAYHYNSYDFVLLSHIMELVSGTTYLQYIQNHVLEPIGMLHTGTEQQFSNALVHFYTRRGSKLRPATAVNNDYKLAGGGLVSNIEDILRLGQSLLRKEHLKPSILQKLTTACTLADGSSTYYGYGFESSLDPNGHTYFGHTGNGIGGYAIFRVYPELDKTIAVLVHCTNPKIEQNLEALVANLLKGMPFRCKK